MTTTLFHLNPLAARWLSAAIIPVEDRARLERLPGLVVARAGQRHSWVEVRRNLACERAVTGGGRSNRMPRLPETVLPRSVSGGPSVAHRHRSCSGVNRHFPFHGQWHCFQVRQSLSSRFLGKVGVMAIRLDHKKEQAGLGAINLGDLQAPHNATVSATGGTDCK